jgi:hypothetical protein
MDPLTSLGASLIPSGVAGIASLFDPSDRRRAAIPGGGSPVLYQPRPKQGLVPADILRGLIDPLSVGLSFAGALDRGPRASAARAEAARSPLGSRAAPLQHGERMVGARLGRPTADAVAEAPFASWDRTARLDPYWRSEVLPPPPRHQVQGWGRMRPRMMY